MLLFLPLNLLPPLPTVLVLVLALVLVLVLVLLQMASFLEVYRIFFLIKGFRL